MDGATFHRRLHASILRVRAFSFCFRSAACLLRLARLDHRFICSHRGRSFFVALLLHSWIGLRDVLMDYVQPLPLRITLLVLLSFVLVGLALWVMKVLLLTQR